MTRLWMATAGAALLAIGAGAQEDRPGGQDRESGKKEGKHAWQQPTQEHAWLKQFEGTWECTSEFTMDKEGRAEKGKGVETGKVAYGGFWLMQDFKGEADGKAFEGHGMIGYDPGRKKFVMTWINSLSPCSLVAEGDAESDGKTFTFRGETVDPRDGKTHKHRLVHAFKDADSRTLTFYGAGHDGGAERKMGEVRYTRGASRR